MRRLPSRSALVLASSSLILLHPALADAAPPVTAAPAVALDPAAPSPPDRGTGWALAAAHLGIGLGVLGAAGIAAAVTPAPTTRSPPDDNLSPVAIYLGGGVLTLGLSIGGGYGVYTLAHRNGWSRVAGWGVLGGILGAAGGGGAGLGAAYVTSPRPSTGTLAGAIAGGAVVGAAVGAPLFTSWSTDDDNMVGEVAGAYIGAAGGFGIAAVSAIAAFPDKSQVVRRAGAGGVGAGIGAFAGMVVGHYVQRRRPMPAALGALRFAPGVGSAQLSGTF